MPCVTVRVDLCRTCAGWVLITMTHETRICMVIIHLPHSIFIVVYARKFTRVDVCRCTQCAYTGYHTSLAVHSHARLHKTRPLSVLDTI